MRKKVAVGDLNLDLVLERCKSGNTKDLTVPMLKAFLDAKNEKGLSKLNKAGLIEKIVQLQ